MHSPQRPLEQDQPPPKEIWQHDRQGIKRFTDKDELSEGMSFGMLAFLFLLIIADCGRSITLIKLYSNEIFDETI